MVHRSYRSHIALTVKLLCQTSMWVPSVTPGTLEREGTTLNTGQHCIRDCPALRAMLLMGHTIWCLWCDAGGSPVPAAHIGGNTCVTMGPAEVVAVIGADTGPAHG
jgi:hypothetical protein